MAQGASLVPKEFTRARQFKGMQRFVFIGGNPNSTDATEGAVMFNDALSLQQCERLMAQLAETVFPFQCAHGRLGSVIRSRSLSDVISHCARRPSLVPLAGTSECALGRDRRPKIDWTRGVSELALSLGMEGSGQC
jgi:hypothetical protein